MRPLVVGVGHPDRGDDAVGPLVAAALWERPGVHADVVHLLEPTQLTELMAGRPLVVLVDAAASQAPPGSLRLDDVTEQPLPAAAGRPVSTHGLGLVDAVAMARLLGTLPARLLVVTVAGSRFDLGQPAQPAVLAAVEGVCAQVRTLLMTGTRG
jgi:hydrogenase maturation protease